MTKTNAGKISESSEEDILNTKKPRKKKKSSYTEKFNINLYYDFQAKFEKSVKIDGDLYKCQEIGCGFECIREAKIKAENHVEWHSKVRKVSRKKGVEKIKCCGKELTKMNYREHVKEMHAEEIVENPFKCFKCQKPIANRKLLRQHLQDHEQNFKCNVCSSSFSRKQVLEYHIINVHSSKNHDGKKKVPTVDGGNSYDDNMVLLRAAEQAGGDVGEQLNANSLSMNDKFM